ncbi:hypothetical protein [Thermaerobacillus caldiproteolyticus]|uniref:hypothetical protein n=1 Tax=Thermaerobacillus caldiproteolyticus TaxID=247480 RepID=UPI0018F18D18|nr:hypothetical protein [Anoxybacillus caldiproteolyticus]
MQKQHFIAVQELNENEKRAAFMVEKILDVVLGPYGRMMGDFYVQHQMLTNTIVVGLALASKFYLKHKKLSTQPNLSVETAGGNEH